MDAEFDALTTTKTDLIPEDFQETEIGLALLDELDALQERGLSRVTHYNMALYIAWKRHPKETRAACGLPVTLRDFCRVIGISESSVRQWRMAHNWLETYIRRRSAVGRSILDEYKNDVFHALGTSASNPNPKHQGDRRTFLQLTGELDGDGTQIHVDTGNDPYNRILAKLSETMESADADAETDVSAGNAA
jgi:hypothetical protein